ncbi:acyl-ACP thioesterase domain-containing protein [Oscillibacter sp.]|uniref:acyl-[acyl-carrier-protein] thioesterase n=1 Tax=Oscillibacter sp. TaxID=1945593 RepID=UPI00262BD032|nr:acyl-ACP thioesterase domain-containing protein [Oscillibacter sp.]MDD3347000.1 thioesterase [Oscillibacter sp.]
MKDFKQCLTENSYFRQEELVFADCDRNQRARVAALLSKVGAYAGYDYDARGLTHDYLYTLGEIFLLSRVALRMHRCPCAGEVLDITTWENGTRGAHMQRVFEMADQTGAVCVSAKSDWILVDPKTRKILRPASFTAKSLTVCPKEIDCPEPRKLFLPQEGAEELGFRPVRWSDLDGNGHLYSGRYGDIVWDALPDALQEQTPREFYINYSKEATLGEQLRLLGRREGAEYRMEGLGNDGTCFSALCVF